MQLGVESVRSRLKGLEGSGSSPGNSIYVGIYGLFSE